MPDDLGRPAGLPTRRPSPAPLLPAVPRDDPDGPRTADFEGLSIRWDPRVLEPRPWTAAQSTWAAKIAEQAPYGPLLELCSGAGHIGLLAALLSRRELVQVDADPVACDYARTNAEAAGIVTDVRCGDLREAVRGERYPVVVADPPWVPTQDVGTFPADPVTAIDGGPEGMDLALACLDVAAEVLLPGGSVVIQVGGVHHLPALNGHDAVLGGRLVFAEAREFERGLLAHLTAAG
ncbi:methyltransferase [Nocardioides zeae]|uniref:methyltransferase n=1 Tax=Nocardioides zeae TaxID=1457234 RepID=UPI0019D662B8